MCRFPPYQGIGRFLMYYKVVSCLPILLFDSISMARPCLDSRCHVGANRRRRSLLLFILLGTICSSSALFGRRRGGRYRGGVPRPTYQNDPAYKAYRQKVYGEAATTFRPYAREDEEEEAREGKQSNSATFLQGIRQQFCNHRFFPKHGPQK